MRMFLMLAAATVVAFAMAACEHTTVVHDRDPEVSRNHTTTTVVRPGESDDRRDHDKDKVIIQQHD